MFFHIFTPSFFMDHYIQEPLFLALSRKKLPVLQDLSEFYSCPSKGVPHKNCTKSQNIHIYTLELSYSTLFIALLRRNKCSRGLDVEFMR